MIKNLAKMSTNVETVTKLYKSLSQIPNVVGARFTQKGTRVDSIWSQRNIEKGKTTKFLKSNFLSSDFILESIPVDISSELLSSTSPLERYRAVLRDADDKQYLEIWQNQNLCRTVDLNAVDLHGKVYTDGEFQSFQWSPDEKKVLYIAEYKWPKSEPFYKRTGKKSKKDSDEPAEKIIKGDDHLYRQDWGEQLVGKQRSIIAEYNIETDTVEIVNGIPENICPAQVIYSPDGKLIVGVAYETEPRKLGLIYCTNRVSTIFSLDFAGNYETLPLENAAVKSPVFAPDGKTLVWMQRKAGGPHAAGMALMKTTLPLKQNTPKNFVDIVKSEVKTYNDENFYGLYNSGFVKRCFASDNRLILSTNQRNTINTYVIDIDSGKITELKYDNGSQIVLDVYNDTILVNRRNFLCRDKLAVGYLPPKGREEPVNFMELSPSEITPGLEDSTYEYLDLVQDTDDSVKSFSAIYLGPKSAPPKSKTLIVWPHGGPHSAYANNFTLEGSLLLSLGYCVLFINYRGSIGAGQDSVEFLLGKIGKADVADCILATDTALKKYDFLDPERLVLVGGSHGGFLVTHLSGQFPDKFKAVIARNPVIDVASMSVISDIPDWCYVEAGAEYTQKNKIDDDVLLAMRKASPIEYAHLVKAPTLLQIGSKDLRVPPHQGLDYYHRLKANGAEVRLNLYEDNHPLGSVPNEMDYLISTVLWIEKHLPKSD